jgi:hypothetical protein
MLNVSFMQYKSGRTNTGSSATRAACLIPPCDCAAADDVSLMRRWCDACSIFSSKLAEPPEGLQVMGVEDPDFTSLCRLAKESRGALPRQVSSRPGDPTASSTTGSTRNR